MACHTCGQNMQWFPNSHTSIWNTCDPSEVVGPMVNPKNETISHWIQSTTSTLSLTLSSHSLSCLHCLMAALESQPMVAKDPISASEPFPTWTTAFPSFSLSSFCSFLFSYISIHWYHPVTTPVSATLHQHSCSQARSRQRMVTRLQGPKILQ